MVENTGKCPFHGTHVRKEKSASSRWWPNQLNLSILHQHTAESNPLDDDFDYAKAFSDLDLDAVKADLNKVMTDSKPWWPADYGHYGPFFIRMAWHAAGTYRVGDGRGGAGSGAIRFAPLNSWPDNANLDKAIRLLWPVKKKYGRNISWADLIVLTGNVALESMGFDTFGFAGGREDIYAPNEDADWGPETGWLDDARYSGDRELEGPLGAVQMGLIYVNPEGPNGDPDPLKAARDIRETFARMAMDDEETVALIAGGHTFGKVHGAVSDDNIGPEPEGAPLEQMGLGWKNSHGNGNGIHSFTSGLEGAWTTEPAKWDMGYFDNLFNYEWELTKSPAGAQQWRPTDRSADDAVPDAHDPNIKHAPMMLTTDLALRFDPAYEKISRRFHENPDQFADAFARAWFKLMHRDMGPVSRYLGKEVPSEDLLWQDPVPAVDHELVDDADVASIKSKLLDCGLSHSQLIKTAWAAASSFRGTDKRGGANGGRIRLAPQSGWAVNEPEELGKAIAALNTLQAEVNATLTGGKKISFADLVVLGGCAAVEAGAKAAGVDVTVPFTPGRTDATAEQTDVDAMAVLETRADGFRNYADASLKRNVEELLVDKAFLLNLTAPEMTVLVGGLRVLGANHGNTGHGVLTDRPGALTTDFFVNIVDLDVEWSKRDDASGVFEGKDRATGDVKWTGTAADLVFGSNSQLRAICQVYGCDDAKEKFVHDFVAAWDKVMMLDRFDVA